MALVYAHLIACCAVIGLILMSDIAMVKQLISGGPHERMDPKHLQDLQKHRGTGPCCTLGHQRRHHCAGHIGQRPGVLRQPQAAGQKITVVALLTLNGILLHHRVLPLMKKAGTLLNMSFSQRSFAMFAGSVSAVSWFYAALLGVGRPLSWKYPLTQILAAYPVLIAGGFAALMLMLMVAWAQYRTSGESRSFEGTRFVGVH